MSTHRNVVVRNIDRADAQVVTGLAEAGASTVHEAMGRRGFVGADIRPIQEAASIAGSAITVSCHPGDNLMIHAAVEVCRAGDLLVVTNTGPSEHGMFGDLLATSLMTRGVVGLVMDAGVRDVRTLREMGFPVWARHVSPLGTVKAKPGSVNVPVTIGDIRINPGDVVCADDDGVVIVPRTEALDTLESARARIDREEVKRKRLSSGELSLDIDGLRAKLDGLGVEYIDEEPR